MAQLRELTGPGLKPVEAPPQEEGPNAALDFAKGLGSGVERGVVGLPGLPGDIIELLRQAHLRVQGLYGPEYRRQAEATTAYNPLPTSSEVIDAAKPYVPGLGFQPETTGGQVAQRVGEFLPGAVVPGQAFVRGATTGARAARAGFDALTQGVAPALAAEGAERAAKGGPLEPYAAPVAAIATSLAAGRIPPPRAATPVPGYAPGATSRVNRAIEDEGGHAAVATELDRLGTEGRLMDVGPNLTGQAEALVSSPGRAQSEVLRVVRERREAAPDRISTAVDRVIGNPINYDRETQALLNQRRLRAARFYGQAEGHTTPIDTTPVVQQIDRQLPWRPANDPDVPTHTPIERNLINVREQLVGRSDMRSLHNVKESLDDQIAAAVRNNEGGLARQLGQVRDQLVRQIDAGTTVNGQSLYRQAREAYAGDSAILRAREEGLHVFDRDVNPNTMARENLARTEAERIAFTGGAREALEVKMGNASNEALEVRNLFEKRANRAKLIQIVGQREADELINVLRQETRLAGTSARMTQQSATAGRQAAQKEIPSSLPESKPPWPDMVQLPTWALQKAYRGTVGPVIDAVTRTRRGEVAGDLGRLHTMPSGDERARLLEQLRRSYEGVGQGTPPWVAAPMAGRSAELDEDRPPLEITVHGGRRR